MSEELIELRLVVLFTLDWIERQGDELDRSWARAMRSKLFLSSEKKSHEPRSVDQGSSTNGRARLRGPGRASVVA